MTQGLFFVIFLRHLLHPLHIAAVERSLRLALLIVGLIAFEIAITIGQMLERKVG